jgi:chaperone modulatory protein CbpM
MRVEYSQALWLSEHQQMTLTELAEFSGFTESELNELIDCGALEPLAVQQEQRVFGAQCITLLRTAFRLRDDFELDTQGLALALALLERVNELESQLRHLQARLPQRR